MAASCYVMAYRRSFAFRASPDDVWSSIEALDRFEGWWGWLSELDVEGDGLRTGSILRGTVAPPLPYRMRVSVVLERCEAPRMIDAAVHGDLEGDAHLRLADRGGSTRADVSWTIEMMQTPMRVAARVAYPLLRWGHDRVVDATVRGFEARLDNA